MRKTKVICTLGPATDSEETLRALVEGGMNAARFNFSHGTHESHLAQLTKLKKVREELGASVATILDTKGPEIRIRTFTDGPVTLTQGQTFTLTTDDDNDNMLVEVELEDLFTDVYQRLQALQKRIQRALKDEILLTPHVKLVPKNTLPVSDGKAVRVVDKRKVYQ